MRVRSSLLLVLASFVGCSDNAGSADPGNQGPTPSEASTDAGGGDGGAPPSDAGTQDAKPAQDAAPSQDEDAHAGGGTYRNSLSVCWTDATCPRALAISHGGDWNTVNPPYDSNAALAAAFAHDADGVKIDVRVTSDNVPVIAHSSPIQIYESLDCANKKIEEMTAAQVVACHRAPSATETFQRLDDVLSYLRNKLVVQLCVKLPTDYARTIAEVNALGAQDFAFFEISPADLKNVIPTIPGSDKVYYLINFGSSTSEVNDILQLNNPRAFMYEFDPGVQLGTLVTTKLHPANVRAFTYDSSTSASEQELEALFKKGYDVVSSQVTASNVQARSAVNKTRGVTPP